MIKKDRIDKTRKLWRSPVRKSSDPRFDGLSKFVRTEDESRPRLPHLPNCFVFLKKTKEVNGVLTLNNACEGKYKSMAINTEEITEKSGFSRHGEYFPGI